jgi:hypothetical protein
MAAWQTAVLIITANNINNIRFMAAFFTSLYSIILVKTKIGEYFPPSFCFSLICYRENPIAGRD